MTDTNKPVVVIAEDEPSIAEGYELWLSEQYEVRLATDGREALDLVDDTIDIVLLDRMMPELSGKQVLRELREQGIDCRVVMVTAVEPDFDVVEMGFDAYITKPPERQELLDTIEQLLDRASVDDAFQEYHSLMARKGALQTQKTEEELSGSERYQDLLNRIESKRAEVDDGLGDLESDIDFVSAVREVESNEEEEGGSFDDVDLGDIEGFEEGDPEGDEGSTENGPDEELESDGGS